MTPSSNLDAAQLDSGVDQNRQKKWELLAQFGHFYLMLESHEQAAQYCRTQLGALREELAQIAL